MLLWTTGRFVLNFGKKDQDSILLDEGIRFTLNDKRKFRSRNSGRFSLKSQMRSGHPSRRRFLTTFAGLSGFSFLKSLRAGGRVRAKSCIIVYTWGGMSHLESFDPKPEGPEMTRGEFKAISTATPGIQFCEHLPLLAKHTEKLAIVRSLHHRHGGHQHVWLIRMQF